jgi:hypothetical protein
MDLKPSVKFSRIIDKIRALLAEYDVRPLDSAYSVRRRALERQGRALFAREVLPLVTGVTGWRPKATCASFGAAGAG